MRWPVCPICGGKGSHNPFRGLVPVGAEQEERWRRLLERHGEVKCGLCKGTGRLEEGK